MKAFILAAGLGTRLKPFTDHHPKALATVNGKTLLEINIRKLVSIGITDIVVNVFHFAEQIIDILAQNDGFGARYQISDERPEVLETGGGIKNAYELLKDDEDVLIINVDILSNINLEAMMAAHTASSAMATLAVMNRDSSRSLLFTTQDNHLRLCGWRNNNTLEEKRPMNNVEDATIFPKSFSGIHIIKTSLIPMFKETGKFSIIDSYLNLCSEVPLLAFDHSDDVLLDVGKPAALAAAATLF